MTTTPITIWAGFSDLSRNIALVVAGTILLAISAQITVPMWPVPMTLQTLAVLFIGISYGGRLATTTLLLYLAQGAFGMPVFAAGGGMPHLLGPTGGYLLGFLFAASLLGWASDRGMTRSAPMLSLYLLLSTLAIYVPGSLWLSSFVGFKSALFAGILPFLLGDLVKATIVGMVVYFGKKISRGV
ncbi:MAG: biotin transporter BioY [Sulfitobacter sp.]|uniref:biotin transporter BioY n=1 Tax=Alphaproteobacteria TaxID=28211 RepID=UPI0029426627|nr:biotin transporter BioY [Sulfitobacter sp. LC.270.F.C4]WOI13416.1 biotin transporter BioY [Sulfitobacter sp. LC.270.F.C4]